jgi:aspartate kinase
MMSALAEAGISVQGAHQSIRQVQMQCVVKEDDYAQTVAVLHRALVEREGYGDVISAA